MERYDVVVVGGGPAGAATSIRLGNEGWRVLLIDAVPANAFRVGESLPPTGKSLLRQLGAWERFLAEKHRVSHGNLSSWGSSDLVMTDFIFQLSGHGFQLDRACFDALLKTIAQESGVQLSTGARVDQVTSLPDKSFRLKLAGKEADAEIESRWLVDASGRRSLVAQSQGATRQVSDRLAAFYTILQSASTDDQDGCTWVEAAPDGWWYSVLLPAQGRLVVYLTDWDLVNRRQFLSRAGFQQALDGTQHIHALCASYGYVLRDRPRGADASSARLSQFTGANWLAVGDAALSFDPLSSQGICNALYTGIQAGKCISAALNGAEQAVTSYALHLSAIYQAYLKNRAIFYAYETRWVDHPFWARRVSQMVIPPQSA